MRMLTTMILALSLATPSMAAPCPAENLVQNAGAAFMGASRAGTSGAFIGAASRFADLRGLALFALGPYRKNLPKNREAEYVALARQFMGRFMAQYASRFSGNAITITSCGGNVIGTKLSTGQSLNFRLRGSNRIEDVSISGVWLAQTMRSKFVGVLNSHGGDVDALIGWLAN